MSAPDGGDVRWLDAVKDVWAVFKEVWLALVPSTAVGWWTWRRLSWARADKRAQEGRTEQERRDDAWRARFERLGAAEQEAFRRSEAERDRAVKRAEEADARADAAERERWRMELWARDYEHALGDARRAADDARAKASLPPAEWKPVPRPTLPGDPV